MLEHVRTLSKNNLMTVAQFTSNDAIDQYIAVLDKDSKEVMAQKSWNDGYLSRVGIGFIESLASISAGVSVGFGAVAGIGTYRARNLWNSYSRWLLDSRSYGAMVKDVYKETLNDPSYLEYAMNEPTLENEKTAMLHYSKSLKMSNILFGSGDEAIDKRNYETMAIGLISPVAGIIGATCALGAFCGFVAAYQKISQRKAHSAMMQEQFDNNQLITAQLRQIQYNMSH